MANIMNVDYKAMPKQAESIREGGVEINKELTVAYTSVANMHNVWYGKRYNSLVLDLNNIIPQLNEFLKLVVGEIPYALETIANNYSQVDQGTKVVGADNTAPTLISEIAESTEVGLKFITEEVETVRTKVSGHLKGVIEKMDSMEVTVNAINWESEAADRFKSTFKSLKNQITTAFSNIEVQFNNLMNEAMDDIQRAENANMV